MIHDPNRLTLTFRRLADKLYIYLVISMLEVKYDILKDESINSTLPETNPRTEASFATFTKGKEFRLVC